MPYDRLGDSCCICGDLVMFYPDRNASSDITHSRLDRTCPGDCRYLLMLMRKQARRLQTECPVCGDPVYPRTGPTGKVRCERCGGPQPPTVRLDAKQWRTVIYSVRKHPGCRRDLIDRVRVRDGLPPIPDYLDSKETADV